MKKDLKKNRTFKMGDAEYAIIKRKATKQGLNVSAYIRQMCCRPKGEEAVK
jgi:predicted DNA binding CopG/RHH family protein